MNQKLFIHYLHPLSHDSTEKYIVSVLKKDIGRDIFTTSKMCFSLNVNGLIHLFMEATFRPCFILFTGHIFQCETFPETWSYISFKSYIHFFTNAFQIELICSKKAQIDPFADLSQYNHVGVSLISRGFFSEYWYKYTCFKI